MADDVYTYDVHFGDPATGMAVLDGLRHTLGRVLTTMEARQRLAEYPSGEKTVHDANVRGALGQLRQLLVSDVPTGTDAALNPFTPTILLSVLKVVARVIRATGLVPWLREKAGDTRTPWDDWAIEVLDTICTWIEGA